MSGGLIVPNDLAGWWCPSIDATGGILPDRSGRNNHGTLTNMAPATAWVISGGKGALSFSSSSVNLQRQPILGTGNWSIFAWANFTSFSARRTIVQIGSSATNGGIFLRSQTTGQLNLDLSGTGGPNSSVVMSAGAWNHVGVTNFSGLMQLYVNGSAAGSQAMSPNIGTGLTPMIGNDSFGLPMLGQLDDIRIYNRALTAGEARQLWQIGRGNMLLRRRRRYKQAAGGNRRRRVLLGAEC